MSQDLKLADDSIGYAGADHAEQPAWGAVTSLALGVFSLVTAEFLPASLLTPMAATFRVSEALVGQAVTVTAAGALVAALLAAVATRGIDRRLVLMGFSVLLIASNLLVALAPDLTVLLLARLLLGIALGGFWSMATAVAMRLVPPAMLPRALSMIFSGVSVATIAAAPLGAWLGHLYGWRTVFLLAMSIGVVTLLFQAATLPALASTGTARLRTLADVLARPGIAIGMLGPVLVFGGHFGLFTFIRPLLEDAAGIGIDTMSLILLGFGIANFAGTLLAGLLLERSLRLTLTLMPLAIGAAGLALAGYHAGALACTVPMIVWGLAFGGVPVGWSTWLARAVPDEAESAGGLLVAAVQLAIAAGAAAGGAVFGLAGVTGVFTTGGVLLLLTAAAIFIRNPRTG